MPVPRITLALLTACLLLAIGAPAVPVTVDRIAWTDELGEDARPGPMHYVALGDSFTSGEGDPYVDPNEVDEWVALTKYERCVLAPADLQGACIKKRPSDKEIENGVGWLGDTGTDISKLDLVEQQAANVADGYSFGGNNCHRSAHAYPVRVWGALDADDPSWGVSFAACSGALVEHVRTGFRGEDPQFDAFVNEQADLVTLGFGGNDIGFGNIVMCVLGQGAARPGFNVCDPLFGLDEKLASLSRDLGELYDSVRTSNVLDEGARVIAIGYPRLFPAEPPDSCSLGSAASVGEGTMKWLNEVADRLNATIEATAAAHGIEYVDTADIIAVPDQNGVRHDFCVDEDDQRWVNRFIPSDLRRSMHPKYQYHERVAERVLACWRGTASCAPRA